MWKHKTKWLLRGGRKVKCYLCGKKILAKGDLFLFHGDTGYYSHQSCQAESTTISGNERRRAVKKIAVGAAVVGAIAAGAGKLIDISSQSKNSPAAQTILTSQGLIPPALTSDPSNPVPGQMWYRSDAGVMAHFDGVQNRVVYSSEINDGNVHVTSKGIINGLSVLPNDGTGWFGPDTTKGATAPGQYGSPYTVTNGIMEAKEALPKVKNLASGRMVPSGTIQIKFSGYPITISQPLLFFDDEFIQLISDDGLTLPIQPSNTPVVYIQNTTAGSSTDSSGDVIHIARNPDASTTGSNLGNGVLYFDGITLSKNNVGNLFNANSYYINGTLTYGVPNYSQLLIGKLHAYDGTYGNGLLLLNTNGNDDLNTIEEFIGVGGTKNSNIMFGASVNHFTADAVFLLSYESAAPSGSGYSTMVSMSPGLECHFGILDLFAYSNGAYPNGSMIIDNSNDGGIVTIDTLGDEMNGNAAKSYFGSYGFFIQTSKPNYLYIKGYNLGGTASVFASPYGIENVFIENYSQLQLAGNAPFTKTPTISANPPVSGTAYQNTNPYDIRLKIPVTYSPTSSAAATLATGTSSTSTVTTSTKVSYPAGITTGIIDTYEMVVKAGQYFELVATNATIGTVEVEQA